MLPAVNTKCGPFFFRRRVQKWASFVHPGAHTLGIASTQRLESANSALKQVLRRSGTLGNVDQAIIGKVQDDTNKTIRLAFSSPGFLLAWQKVDSTRNCRPLHVYHTKHQVWIVLLMRLDYAGTKLASCKSRVATRRARNANCRKTRTTSLWLWVFHIACPEELTNQQIRKSMRLWLTHLSTTTIFNHCVLSG